MMDRRRALMSQTGGSGYAHGTWEDLFWHIDKGDYATEYSIGEEITTILKNNSSFPFQIVGFDADTISNTTKKAPVTLISKGLYVKRKFNDANTDPVSDGYGTYGGWDMSNARNYCNNTVINNIPDNVVARIVSVKKYSKTIYANGSVQDNKLTNDKIWLPGSRELNLSSNVSNGPKYSGWFTNNSRRIKRYGGTATKYFMRDNSSASPSTTMYIIATTGIGSTTSPTESLGYAIGFCVGKESVT